MIDPLKKTYRCKCKRCGAKFKIVSSVGISVMCDDCAFILLGIIWGGTVTGRDKFGNVIVRSDLCTPRM